MNQTMYYLKKRLWLAIHNAGKSTHEIILPAKDWNSIRKGRPVEEKPDVPDKEDWEEWTRNLPAKFLESQSTRNSQLL